MSLIPSLEIIVKHPLAFPGTNVIELWSEAGVSLGPSISVADNTPERIICELLLDSLQTRSKEMPFETEV